ncbi:MAG: sugar ABC transporter permease [Nitrososphaeria archaeon]
MNKIKKDILLPYLLLFPFFILLITFILYPIFSEITFAFSEKKAGLEPIFVGFNNFIKISASTEYQKALINTTLYVGLGVNLKMLLALLFATLLATEFKFNRIIAGLILLPWIMPSISTLFAYRYILDTDYGILNFLLKNFGLRPQAWLASYDFAMAAIIIFHIWRNLPFWTITFFAGLQGIPIELYEAAKIDGADSIKTFINITLPLIKNLYLVCVLISTIWTLGDFNTVWVLTRGGPGSSTHVISTLAYRYAFEMGDLGISSAILVSVLPAIIILIFVILKYLKW